MKPDWNTPPPKDRFIRTYPIYATAEQTGEIFRDAIAGTPSLWDRPITLNDQQFSDILERVIRAHWRILHGSTEPEKFTHKARPTRHHLTPPSEAIE